MKTSNYYYNRVKRATQVKNIKEAVFQVFMIAAFVGICVMAFALYFM